MGKRIICYHGTTSEASQSILRMGFKSDSWFALSLQNALAFGGLYVFEVAFEFEKIPQEVWQFHVLRVIPVERIIRCRVFSLQTIYETGR